jgi:hypothetical protein
MVTSFSHTFSCFQLLLVLLHLLCAHICKLRQKTAAIIASLMLKCGKFEVTYQEKYDTYYVFNTETGAFVAQNENPVTLLEYMRDHYISYNLEAADENTARTMVASVKRIMTEKQKSELFQHGVQEV